jgi:hypothetical protein
MYPAKPASKSHRTQLDLVPTDQVDADFECAICWEREYPTHTDPAQHKPEFNNVRRTPCCKHDFHEGCLGHWLQQERTCPLCRGDFTAHFPGPGTGAGGAPATADAAAANANPV